MTEMVIERGVVIDDIDDVLFRISKLSGRQVSDLGVIRRFITQEKNTRFFFDSKLNSYMQRQPDCIYTWLDTGYTDWSGDPIFISLIQKMDSFHGHVVGTADFLADSVKRHFKLDNGMVNRKTENFRKKYDVKAGERHIKHILDEQTYLVNSLHQFESTTEFGMKLASLNLVYSVAEEDAADETVLVDEAVEEYSESGLSESQEKMTIEILLEKMETMQTDMDKLIHEIERVNTESSARIDELQEKNDEYKRVILQMREFTGCTQDHTFEKEVDSVEIPGHDLLGRHGKILVIGGQELGTNIIHGIAKSLGFEKKDFETWDYDKTKDYADRIRKDGRFKAVIVGACPHKTTNVYGFSSTVEKLKNTEDMPFTVDARSKSGKLKVTKDSLRRALLEVRDNLRLDTAI